ncbi:unnamed protein product [Cladocopium goreaui]|uniref:Ribosomal RNA small subunit methyltransferase G (16S rRNA 7-methylguanosine methyltransferase) (16S rRNA m7G methyltransferase) n=1 Tax=Cladocopium goreaui TaxID=2562237 RepID=A0A9P1CUL4_9DINO|nr:unnamed protein product [Cladocopium goreaui]
MTRGPTLPPLPQVAPLPRFGCRRFALPFALYAVVIAARANEPQRASPFVPFVRTAYLAVDREEGSDGLAAIVPNTTTTNSTRVATQTQPGSFFSIGNYGGAEDDIGTIDVSSDGGFNRANVDDSIAALGVYDLAASDPPTPDPDETVLDQQIAIILNDLNNALTVINALDDEDQLGFIGVSGSFTAASVALQDLVIAQETLPNNPPLGEASPNQLDAEIAALNAALIFLNLDLAGIVLEVDDAGGGDGAAADGGDTRLADDINQNGSGGAIRVLADIDGDGVTEPDEVVAVINDFGDVHEFNVFFDQVAVHERFTANSIELMKQTVLGGGPASASDGWRVDGFVDDWSFGVGDEVRGLSPLPPSFISRVGAEGVRRWMQGLSVSTYGSAGVRAMHLEDRFSFLGLDSILGRTSVNQENDHYVLGPQLGLGWVAEGPTLRFEAALLGLAGYGRVERRQAGVFGEEVIPGALNRAATASSTSSRRADGDDRVAWHGESRLTASCQLTQRLRFDATWRWMVTGPISSAYESVGWNAPDFGLSRTNDDQRLTLDNHSPVQHSLVALAMAAIAAAYTVAEEPAPNPLFSSFIQAQLNTESTSHRLDAGDFNIFFDDTVWEESLTPYEVAISKQHVFGGGEANRFARGWRVDSAIDAWRLRFGDEVRGLRPVNAGGFRPGTPQAVVAWFDEMRVSTYGISGIEYQRADSEFYFQGVGSVLGRTMVNTRIDHDLVGPRLGLGAVAESSIWRFEAVALGSVGYGWWERRQNGVFGEELIPGALNRPVVARTSVSANGDDGDGVAWSGEIRLTAGCQLTQRWRFDATWRYGFIGPVQDAYRATAWNAPEFGLNPEDGRTLDGDAWFLGFTYTHCRDLVARGALPPRQEAAVAELFDLFDRHAMTRQIGHGQTRRPISVRSSSDITAAVPSDSARSYAFLPSILIAFDVVARAAATEHERAAVSLRLPLDVLDELRRLADAEHEHAGGDRVERPRVADLGRLHAVALGDLLEQPLHAVDRVARRDASGLVDVQEAEQVAHSSTVARAKPSWPLAPTVCTTVAATRDSVVSSSTSEVVGDRRFVGVDEDQVERPGAFLLELGKRLDRPAHPDVDAVRDAGVGEVRPSDFGVTRVGFERRDTPVLGERSGEPDRAVAAEGADLEHAFRRDRAGQHLQQLALVRRDGDLRQPGFLAGGQGGVERGVVLREARAEIVIDRAIDFGGHRRLDSRETKRAAARRVYERAGVQDNRRGAGKHPSAFAAIQLHDLEIDEPSLEKLDAYRESLWSWNEKLNLTRHTTLEKFVARDLFDTLQLSALIDEGERVLDIGSGGGVPGLPLSVLRPDLDVSVCESVAKKANVLASMVETLSLPVTVYGERVEHLFEPEAGVAPFETLIARAVAPLWKFMRWLRPQPDQWGRLLLIKGPSWVEERGEARHRGLMKGYQLRRVAEYTTPGSDAVSTVLSVSR